MYKILTKKQEQDLLTKNLHHSQYVLFQAAARKLGYKVKIIAYFNVIESDGKKAKRPVFEFSHKGKSLYNTGAVTNETSYLGMKLAENKSITAQILRAHQVPTPFQAHISKKQDFKKLLARYTPVVVKPWDSAAGKGVVGNVYTYAQASAAYDLIKTLLPKTDVIAEEQISGDEFRAVVINGKFAAAVYYQPPIIVGDGKTTIKNLIAKENTSKLRKKGFTYPIKVNKPLDFNLKTVGMTLRSVPRDREQIVLHKAAPISNGGMMIDVTDDVCRENRQLFEKISGLFDLNISGIDIIAPSLEHPIVKTGGKIIEVNGGPDFRVHANVHYGKQRNLAEIVLRDFFEPKRKLH